MQQNAKKASQPCELIDTQWNVNIGLGLMAITMGIELIDTQWNVNLYAVDNELNVVDELIDAQWNVNLRYTVLFYISL